MRAVDIPQADSLSRIRELVQTIHFGASDTASLQKVMSLHPRHVGYHLHAARVLLWIEKVDNKWTVTHLGSELLGTAAGSKEEGAVFRKSITGSEYLLAIAPNLLEDNEPEQDLLSLRIQEVAGIAPATARRRASTLLRWRTQVYRPACVVSRLVTYPMMTRQIARACEFMPPMWSGTVY